jgi:hypothetical protein
MTSNPFRLGVLKCEEWPASWIEKHGDVDELYPSLFRKAGYPIESRTFRCTQGQLPSKEDIESLDGFCLTGSPSSAYDTDEWISKLYDVIRQIYSMKKKMVGICFGHQVRKIRFSSIRELFSRQFLEFKLQKLL